MDLKEQTAAKNKQIAELKRKHLKEIEAINKVRAAKGLTPLKPERRHWSRLTDIG